MPQQAAGHRGQRRIPLGDDPGQLGHSRRPLVGTLQPQIIGLVRAAHRVALRPDVDLLAPVHLAAGQLATQPGVAAEMRTAHHRDGVLLRLRQREQTLRRGQHPASKRLGHAMPDQVEEAHLVGHLAQAFPQLARAVTQVHFGQRRDA